MIVKKYWRKYNRRNMERTDYMGIFLLGFIPLYIEMIPQY